MIRMLFQKKKGGAVRTLSGLLDDLGRLFLGFEQGLDALALLGGLEERII